MKLTVERLGHRGEGIAAGPEGPVYLPMTLPGELVEAEVAGTRGSEVRIVTPSAERVAPPDGPVGDCATRGGCFATP